MTKYAVISDVHIGLTDKLQQLKQTVDKLRNQGYRIIWLGDTYDVILTENIEYISESFINPEDIRIRGNHDWKENLPDYFIDKGIFFTHGDLIDFGFFAMRFSPENKNKNLFEKFMSLFRKWSVNDVYLLYREIESLSDSEVSSFHKGLRSGIKYIPRYLKLAYNLLSYPKSLPFVTNVEVPCATYNNYITGDTALLLPRIQALYPQSKDYRVVVVGHMHRSIDHTINGTRFICVNAWTPQRTPDIMFIEEDGSIKVIPAMNYILE